MNRTPYETALGCLSRAATAADLELDWPKEPPNSSPWSPLDLDSEEIHCRLVSRRRVGRWVFRWTRTRIHGAVYLRRDSEERLSGVRWHCFDPAKADILCEHLGHLPRLESAVRLRPSVEAVAERLQSVA
mgnify:CR=1 FL=1